jgi:hypothetical protein
VFGVEHNLYQPDASISTMKAHHNKYRNSRGRVSQAGREDLQIGRHVFLDKMFITKQRFNAYMKYLKKRIGKKAKVAGTKLRPHSKRQGQSG